MTPALLIIGGWLCLMHASDALNCPRNYNLQHGGSCYLFSHDTETWTGAMISCQVLEGHLVEINSADEFSFLQRQAQQHSGARVSWWIGLSEKRGPGQWEWATSHTQLEHYYAQWATGEPDQYAHTAEEACVVMDEPQPHDYHWADVKCERLQQYICEAEPFQPPVIV